MSIGNNSMPTWTSSISPILPISTVAANSSTYTTVAASQVSNINMSYNISGASGYTTSVNNLANTSTIIFNNNNNQEIVRLNKDGSVTWSKDVDVDAAADAFGKSLQLGAERSVGITQGVKQRMRDTIFEEMIELAKIKGSLNADDLTYMLSAAKIMDRLKGGYE